MYQVLDQQNESIEIALDEQLTVDEFKQVVHQLESLSAMHSKINVLFDASQLENYDAGIVMEEYSFYKDYKDHLQRVAVVSDRRIQSFFTTLLSKFVDMELKAFPSDQIESARKWVFGSKLP